MKSWPLIGEVSPTCSGPDILSMVLVTMPNGRGDAVGSGARAETAGAACCSAGIAWKTGRRVLTGKSVSRSVASWFSFRKLPRTRSLASPALSTNSWSWTPSSEWPLPLAINESREAAPHCQFCPRRSKSQLVAPSPPPKAWMLPFQKPWHVCRAGKWRLTSPWPCP